MKYIDRYFETTPNWVILMIIGAIIAIIIISSLKRHPFVGFLVAGVLVFAFFGTDLKEKFSDFDADQIINKEKVEDISDKLIENDNSGFFENLLEKDSEEDMQDNNEENNLQNDDEDSNEGLLSDYENSAKEKAKFLGLNPQAVEMIKQGFSNLFTKDE